MSILNHTESLSEDYNSEMLKTIQEFCNKKKYQEDYCLFYPSFGLRPEGAEFIVYGQATKGWQPTFNTNDIVEKKLICEADNYSNTTNENSDEISPLDWVNINWSKSTKSRHNPISIIEGYDTCRSFFWNVCYKLISDYYNLDNKDTNRWCEKMVWSNLMKIAPDKANPNEEDYDVQVEGCVTLFLKELKEIKPKYAILLTNYSWAEPFVAKCTGKKVNGNSPIEWLGTYHNTRIIVTSRPFAGNSEKYVDAILNEIKQP